MNNINNLVSHCTDLLNKSSRSANRVDNGMHYPTVINYVSKTNDSSDFFSLSNELFARIWNVASQYILKLDNGKPLIDNSKIFHSDNLAECEKVICSYENKNHFTDLTRLCLFSIINTEKMNLDDIKEQTKQCLKLEEIFERNCIHCVFYIVHDSKLINTLGNYVLKNNEFLGFDYNGCFIISTQSNNGISYSSNLPVAIYPSIINTIIVSNNDAKGSYDDHDFFERSSILLTQKNNFFVAFSHTDKPSKDIALQIVNKFVDKLSIERQNYINALVEDYQKNPMSWKEAAWKSKLLINDLTTSDIDDDFRSELANIKFLPFRNAYNLKEGNELLVKPYNQLKQLIYTEALDEFIKVIVNNHCKEINIDSWVDKINESLNPLDLINIKLETVDIIFNKTKVSTDERLNLLEYIKNLILQKQKNMKLQKAKSFILQLKEKVSCNAEHLEFFRNNIPLPNSSEIGTFYENLANVEYIDIKDFEKDIDYKLIHKDDDDYYQKIMCDYLYRKISEFVDKKSTIFNVPLTEELANRIGSNTDEANKIIKDKFDKDLNDTLNRGSVMNTVDRLEVYLFNTESSLCNLIKSFDNVSEKKIQFINTGQNNFLEAIRFSAFTSSIG